MHSFYNMLYVI